METKIPQIIHEAPCNTGAFLYYNNMKYVEIIMKSENVNVLDKKPEQIFDELTSNMDLSAKQRNRIQAFKQTITNSEQKDEQQRKYERLNAQLKMARITRMH